MYCQKPDLDASFAGGRAVIYDPCSGSATVLNPTGSILWKSLENPVGAGELERVITEAFPAIPTESARSDVSQFLESLLKAGLVVKVGDTD